MIKNIWSVIQAALVAIGGGFGYFFGGFDGFLYALVAFAVIDYLTGVMCAVINLNSANFVPLQDKPDKIGIYRRFLVVVQRQKKAILVSFSVRAKHK